MSLIPALILIPASLAAASPEPGKIRAACMDLVAKAGIETNMASLLSDALRSEIHDSGAFELMNREDMDAILKELRYQASGACDTTTCVVEMGQALGVEKMISGSVGKFGATFAVNLKMVDIKLAKNDVLFTEYHKGREDDLPGFIRAIAKRLLKEAGNAASSKAEKPGPEPARPLPAAKPPAAAKAGAAAKTPQPQGKAAPAPAVRSRGGKSPGTAALVGLIPGAGQAYNGQRGKALVMGALGLGGLIGMVVTKGSAESARDSYDAAGAGADFDALVADFDSKRSSHHLMAGLTTGICVLSAVDAFVSANRNRRGGTSVSLVPGGVEVSHVLAF
jgi:hypothetical protein